MTLQKPYTPDALPRSEPRPTLQEEEIVAFPTGFLWGVATSAYQVEGATTEGGRGPSIWDTFSHTPGRIHDGASADVSADHYHRLDEDIALMSNRLGVRSYRFSIAWPRVQPGGRGPANQAGLDFYRHLVDKLLTAGIEPWITLYHWDLPQPLQDSGGWPARDTAWRFAEYAATVHAALGDRVTYWTTLNEPWCSAFLGHASGEHAPGVRDSEAAFRSAHHLLLGHGLAVMAMRDAAREEERFGITLNLYPVTPATASEDDLDAARRIDGLHNRLFLDPVLRGRYPDDVLTDAARVTPLTHFLPGDERIVGAPIDMLGVNYYSRHLVSGIGTETPDTTGGSSAYPGGERVRFLLQGLPRTAMGWETDSSGLRETLMRLHEEYPRIPLYVTENGAAYDDTIEDGRVADVERMRFLESHFRATRQAMNLGADVRGFFVWSLLDNFEWAHGYTKRFGIVHVDYSTLRRTPKDSALWYQQVIRRGGIDANQEGAAPDPVD